MGFALTLALGVLTSMFSAITVTRTFMRMLMHTRIQANSWLFGLERTKLLPQAGQAVETEARQAKGA